jgi:hypothetical protein
MDSEHVRSRISAGALAGSARESAYHHGKQMV